MVQFSQPVWSNSQQLPEDVFVCFVLNFSHWPALTLRSPALHWVAYSADFRLVEVWVSLDRLGWELHGQHYDRPEFQTWGLHLGLSWRMLWTWWCVKMKTTRNEKIWSSCAFSWGEMANSSHLGIPGLDRWSCEQCHSCNVFRSDSTVSRTWRTLRTIKGES